MYAYEAEMLFLPAYNSFYPPYFFSFIVFSFVFFLQVLCSQPGVSSPDWQLDQDQLVVEGGEFGLGLSFSGPSEAAVEPCQPRGVRTMRN